MVVGTGQGHWGHTKGDILRAGCQTDRTWGCSETIGTITIKSFKKSCLRYIRNYAILRNPQMGWLPLYIPNIINVVILILNG